MTRSDGISICREHTKHISTISKYTECFANLSPTATFHNCSCIPTSQFYAQILIVGLRETNIQIWFRNTMQDLRGIRLDTQEEQSHFSQRRSNVSHSAVPCTWPLVSAMLCKYSEELVTGPRLENDGSRTVNRVTTTQWWKILHLEQFVCQSWNWSAGCNSSLCHCSRVQPVCYPNTSVKLSTG